MPIDDSAASPTLPSREAPFTSRREVVRGGSVMGGVALGRVILGGAAVGVLTLAASASPSPVGAVTAVRGSAVAFLQSERRALEPQAAVFREDTVTTAAQSRLEIRLGGDTLLRLGEKGRVKIARFAAAGGTLTLEDGAILVEKDPAGATGSLSIESSFGRIAVRGTRFFVGPSRGAFSVLVLRGAVAVEAGGQSIELATGEGTDIPRQGLPPAPPSTWPAARVAAALALVD